MDISTIFILLSCFQTHINPKDTISKRTYFVNWTFLHSTHKRNIQKAVSPPLGGETPRGGLAAKNAELRSFLTGVRSYELTVIKITNNLKSDTFSFIIHMGGYCHVCATSPRLHSLPVQKNAVSPGIPGKNRIAEAGRKQILARHDGKKGSGDHIFSPWFRFSRLRP
jgi:hypothetical protein